MISPPTSEDRFDRWAIGLSGLCLAHCLLSAMVVAMAASAGGLLLHHAVHDVGLMIAIGLGVIGFGRGLIQHGQALPVVLGGAGLAIMGMALTMPHGTGEIAVSIVGVAIVAFGHHLNRRAYR